MINLEPDKLMTSKQDTIVGRYEIEQLIATYLLESQLGLAQT
jgi:hypothetical protein